MWKWHDWQIFWTCCSMSMTLLIIPADAKHHRRRNDKRWAYFYVWHFEHMLTELTTSTSVLSSLGISFNRLRISAMHDSIRWAVLAVFPSDNGLATWGIVCRQHTRLYCTLVPDHVNPHLSRTRKFHFLSINLAYLANLSYQTREVQFKSFTPHNDRPHYSGDIKFGSRSC